MRRRTFIQGVAVTFAGFRMKPCEWEEIENAARLSQFGFPPDMLAILNQGPWTAVVDCEGMRSNKCCEWHGSETPEFAFYRVIDKAYAIPLTERHRYVRAFWGKPSTNILQVK